MNSPVFLTATLGITIMKSQDLMFYTISALTIGLLVAVPVVTGLSVGEGFPGLSICEEWIQAGEQFVFSGNIGKLY